MHIPREIIAQVLTTTVAFLAFFYVAKKLFWASLLHTIEDRQRHITTELERIDALQKKVEALQADYGERLAGVEAEARQRLQEAAENGRAMAEKIAERARKDAEETQEQARRMIEIEMDKARVVLRQEVVKMSIAASEKVIREELDDPKHRRMVNDFLQELGKL